jgi:superfamily II RNA helicase
VRENGHRVTLALERVGSVYEETHALAASARDAAFERVRAGAATALREPRLREARASTEESVALINDLIESLSGRGVERARCERALWGVLEEAEAFERMGRRIEAVRGEVWEPFERRARVLQHFGYLDFFAERVTEQGRWLADLRLDRPLLAGESIARGLFASLDAPRAAGMMAALAADAERDYGELELDDALITALARFDRIAYDVASVEWRQDLEPAPEINFSAAAAAARWAAGLDWATLVRRTRAEEGDLFRMLSRTGESLLQVSNLQDSHPEAARVAAQAAAAVLREPVRS